MANVSNRYPFSTADGQFIPSDILRPISVVKQAFTTGAATTAKDVPATCEVIKVFATENCIIKFAASGSAAAALVDGTITADVFYIQANQLEPIFLSPPVGKKNVSVRGDTASGFIVMQFLETWAGLSLQSQVTRR